MNTAATMGAEPGKKRRFSGLQVFAIVAGVILITVLATVWIIKTWFFPSDFKPVALNGKEQQVLEHKLDRLEGLGGSGGLHLPTQDGAGEDLEPEVYSEENARREIRFSERELNALVARNTNLATRLAVDLSDSLASAKLLIPLDDDFPIMGGKTVKVAAGMELSYSAGRPIVILKGVSIMGVPIPNAWLGNLKNVDLVQQFGSDQGFWKTFAAGVEFIEVRDGELYLKLKE